MKRSGRFAYGIGFQYDYNSVYLPRVLLSLDIEQSVNTPLFYHSSDFSTSLTSHISALYHVNFKNFDSSFHYITAPVFFEFNIGHLASKNFFSDQGLAIGGGYGIVSKGLDIDHGGVFTLAWRSWLKRQSLSTRYIMIVGQNYKYYTLAFMINFGAYLENVRKMNRVTRFTGG